MAIFGDMLMGGINAAIGAANNAISQQYTRENMLYGYQLNEQAANAADARTRKLYGDFYSPQAQMRQLKEAGLSPSIFYGGTPGQGGTAGAQGGTHAMAAPYAPVSMLEGAQVANLLAQAKKTEAETKTITGENERGMAEIAKLWADQKYTNVSAALTAAQITQQEWQNYITSETAETSINTAYSLAERAANDAIKSTFEILSAEAQAHVDQQTINARVEQAIKSVQLTDAEILLKKSGIKLNEANTRRAIEEINKWREEVKMEWQNTYNEIYKARTERMKWRTMDEQMVRSMNVLEKRLNWDKDLGERQFLWTMVNDTYGSMMDACNLVAAPPKMTKNVSISQTVNK